MRILGKRSLSSVLKLLVDIGFWGSIFGGTLLVLVIALVSFAEGDGDGASQNFPVFFELDPSSYVIESVERRVEGDITEARGTLNLRGRQKGLLLMPLLLVLPILVAVVLVLHRLRRVFRRLTEARPFAEENAKDLRFIGLVVILGELSLAGVWYWTMRLVVSEITTTGVTLMAEFRVRLPIIFAGLVLFIVAEVFREGAVMKSDLEAARRIQFSLVSDPEYHAGPVSIHSRMRPADDVGGDYYDVIDLGEDRIAFVLADVAGHGLPAALLMALLQSSLRSLISLGLRGAELVGRLNEYLVANTPTNRMVTFFYGELDLSTGRLAYVNAGHNPPYLYDASGATRLGSTAVVLGSFAGAPFKEATVELPAGARLLLFTDGVTEAANPADEEYGEERLERLLGEQGDIEPGRLIENAVASVYAFCGKARQADDITMMVVSRNGSSGEAVAG